ncbi:MAG TPA: UDP-N-acetylmuramate dehydrogenase [Levilinea sp.]|nr:UDP-N-acetylmuramate dehydrogenase [Levilinea sp.]
MRVSIPIDRLRQSFADKLQENVRLSNYTTARVGGPAAALLIAHTSQELADTCSVLWHLNLPCHVLGSGSNVLASDEGVDAVIVINRAHAVRIDVHTDPPTVWAESGANLGSVARQAALRGLSGLEWAATIPGTIGGAVYGNAGAHGGDMQSNLLVADILHRSSGISNWTGEQMKYSYRSSALKAQPGQAVILAALMKLSCSTREEVQARMNSHTTQRRATQPPGASLGSMFKNPPGDYAGRLIEAAGLKGARAGGAEISSVHANFFVNDENATSSDIYTLIRKAQDAVHKKFGVLLELEIELIGNWPGMAA